MRTMACTHNTDTEQPAIHCTFAQTGAPEISALAPDVIHPHEMARRGYSMLFILNAKGIPSEGKFKFICTNRSKIVIRHKGGWLVSQRVVVRL